MLKTWKSWFLLILLTCIWGSSFLLMKKAMFSNEHQPVFSATQVGALRMFFAGLVLVPIGIPFFKKLFHKRDFLSLALVGFCGNFFPAFLFTYAETGLSSGSTGMLNSFTPIFSLLIGYFIFQQKITINQLVGIVIGTIGLAVLIQHVDNGGKHIPIQGDWTHPAAIVLATFCYAISLNVIRYRLTEFKPIEITSLAFSITFLPAACVTFLAGTVQTSLVNEFAMQGLVATAILSVFGTAIAVVLFSKLIASSGTVFASSVTYLLPIMAILLGISLGEKITSFQYIGIAIILIGVLVMNSWNGIQRILKRN